MQHAPGGKLCFSLSALSESFRTSVYKNRLHRTLNLICWVFRLRLIRAARYPTKGEAESARQFLLLILVQSFLRKESKEDYDRKLLCQCDENSHEASLRLQISMNCLISETSVGIVSGVCEGGREEFVTAEVGREEN